MKFIRLELVRTNDEILNSSDYLTYYVNVLFDDIKAFYTKDKPVFRGEYEEVNGKLEIIRPGTYTYEYYIVTSTNTYQVTEESYEKLKKGVFIS